MRRIVGIGLIATALIVGTLLAMTGNLAPSKAVVSRDLIVDGIGVNVTDVNVDLNWWFVFPLLVCFIVGLVLVIMARNKSV